MAALLSSKLKQRFELPTLSREFFDVLNVAKSNVSVKNVASMFPTLFPPRNRLSHNLCQGGGG
jgi:hypothetical protein